MARLTKRLTDKGLRRRPPGLHPDGDGLYFQVSSGGGKSWILRTMIRGKRRDIGLGGLSTVSLAEARSLAETYRKIARKGGDPIAERDKVQADPPPTFEAAARMVHQDHSPTWRNPKHSAQWINTLSEYAFPVFGAKFVDQVTSTDIMNALGPIWTKKEETARRVRQRIGTVMDWVKARGFRSDNLVEGIKKGLPKQKSKPNHHAALPYSGIPAFISKVRKGDSEASTKLALEFLILTAARTTEVLEAHWDEINFDKAAWTIPAGRMKTNRAHAVPLSRRCLEIIKEAKTLSDGKGYIFPSRQAGKPLSNGVFLMLLRRMKVSVTAHGFRSTFRDWAAEQTNFSA